MDNCIFCKIITGNIPSHKVYEDDNVLAFLDVNPVNLGHTLVVSKKHYPNFLSMSDDDANRLMLVVKKIAPAVLAGVGSQGFNLNLNNGSVSGQVVDHVHAHIIPRHDNDGHHLWSGTPYGDGKAEEVLNSIKKNI